MGDIHGREAVARDAMEAMEAKRAAGFERMSEEQKDAFIQDFRRTKEEVKYAAQRNMVEAARVCLKLAFQDFIVAKEEAWRTSRADLKNNVKVKKTRAKVSKFKQKMREAQLRLEANYADSELDSAHVKDAMNFDVDGFKPYEDIRPQRVPRQ